MNHIVPFRIIESNEDEFNFDIPFHLAPQFEYYPYLYVPGRSHAININQSNYTTVQYNDESDNEDNNTVNNEYEDDDSQVYAYEYEFDFNNPSTLLDETVTPFTEYSDETETETTDENIITPPEYQPELSENFPSEQTYDPESRNLTFRHIGWHNGIPRLIYDISMYNLPSNPSTRQQRIRNALNRLGISLVTYSSYNNELDLINTAIESSVADMEIRRRDHVEIDVPDELYATIKSQDTDQTQCSICFTDFVDEDSICKLNCTHILHSACIREWAKYKDNCPICRSQIPIK